MCAAKMSKALSQSARRWLCRQVTFWEISKMAWAATTFEPTCRNMKQTFKRSAPAKPHRLWILRLPHEQQPRPSGNNARRSLFALSTAPATETGAAGLIMCVYACVWKCDVSMHADIVMICHIIIQYHVYHVRVHECDVSMHADILWWYVIYYYRNMIMSVYAWVWKRDVSMHADIVIICNIMIQYHVYHVCVIICHIMMSIMCV